MKCEFKNCQQEGFAMSIICYSEDGDFDNVLLCKRHAYLMVPKELRDMRKSPDGLRWESVMPIQQQIDRLEQMLGILRGMRKDSGISRICKTCGHDEGYHTRDGTLCVACLEPGTMKNSMSHIFSAGEDGRERK